MKYILFFFCLAASIASCVQNQEVKSNNESSEEEPKAQIVDSVGNSSVDSTEFYLEPPFRDSCEFEFYHMGEVRVSETRCEEVQCGKGWNSEFNSCTWVYGEHIYNQGPPDNLVTDYRMHIVDLDSSEIEMSPDFLLSKFFKDHIIATTILDRKNETFKTIWDPNNTGKYPKPKQWVEE